MIEPEVSLAFSVHSKKGAFALLLGSGVSRSAGIPTGWEVVLDLIRKLAVANGEDCGSDPEGWFIERYSEEPNYSKILGHLTKSPATRNQILRSYFEPNAEEREENLKLPTQAHRSIANLVKEGYIKVVLTTNFDRLLEQSLEQIGIIPTVISTADSINGALPLPHVDCLIVKLHGDYLDTRIKNSPEELGEYSPNLKKLLRRILDEYGLIICGWSAEWDIALLASLESCKSYRFQTFWTYRGKLKENAERIISLRKAEKIEIKDADTFFQDLEQKIISIDEFNESHPLSTKTAIATVKRLLRDKTQDIRLHDFVMGIVESTYSNLSPENFPARQDIAPFSNENFIRRVKNYESYVENLLNIIIAGCYWGDDSTNTLWLKSIQRIANPSGKREGLTVWLNLRHYPALLLFYAAGISSIANGNYDRYASLIDKLWIRSNGEEENLFYSLYLHDAINNDAASILLGGSKRVLALNEYLSTKLRGLFREYLASDTDYQKFFDRFEYLSCLVFGDHLDRENQRGKGLGRFWAPGGIFLFRSYYNEQDNFLNANICENLANEQLAYGENWPPLKAGLFGSSVERFQHIKSEYDAFIRSAYYSYRTAF